MSQRDSIGIAKQTAFGTKQATPEYYLDAESATVDGAPDLMAIDSTVGYSYPQPLEAGTQTYKVTLNVLPRAASLPRLLSAYLGAPTTTTVDVSAKQHAFDPVAAAGVAPYLSALVSRVDPVTDINDLLYDLRGSKFTISTKSGEMVKASFDFLGANNDNTQSTPTPTLDATERFKWHQMKLYANIAGAGEAEIKVNSMEFNYDTLIEDDHYILGSQSLASIPIGTAQAAGLKFTLTEEDASSFSSWYRRALLSSSRPSIVYRIACLGSLVGATTQQAGFEIKMWNSEVLTAPADIDAKTRMRQIEITNRADYDKTNAKFVTINAWNTVATY